MCVICLIAYGVPGAHPFSNIVTYTGIPDPSKVRFRPPHDTLHSASQQLSVCLANAVPIIAHVRPWRGVGTGLMSSDFSQTSRSWVFFWPNVTRCLIKCVRFLGKTSWGFLSGFMANVIRFLAKHHLSHYVQMSSMFLATYASVQPDNAQCWSYLS